MSRSGKIAASILLIVFLLSVLAPLIVPYDPDAINLDALRRPPSFSHPLGTDSKGRDMLARVMYGGKISIGVALASVAVSMGMGLLVGLVSGYFGGRVDMFLMAVVDLLLAFPSLLLAIGISVLFPPGIYTVMIALSAVGWASFARLVRGYVLSLREEPFIEAARAIGCSDSRTLFVHVLPQCMPIAFVMAGLKLGGYILTEAALSFLGLGAQPPAATWGALISSNRVFINSAPWMVLSPGFMIALTALSFNLFGDALKEKYDIDRNVRRP